MFRWLLGFDLTDTLILIDKRNAGKVTFLVSTTKEQALKSLLQPPENLNLDRQPVEVEIIVRTKSNDKQDMDRIAARLKAGPVGGVWNAPGAEMKEPHEGPFAEAFLETVRDESEGIRLLNVEEGVATSVLLCKDMKDVNQVKSACSIVDVVFKKFVVPKIEDEANEGKKATPVKLGEYIEGYFNAPEKISAKLQAALVESCYKPLFSSGAQLPANLGEFENSSKPLDYSVIVCGIGARYKSLCSNVLRTVLINPTDYVTASYNHLVGAFKAAIDSIRPGVSFAEPLRVAKRYLAERDAGLAELLGDSAGHSLGYEFFDGVTLSEKYQDLKFAPSMTLNVMLILNNFNGARVMALADTVLVTANAPEVLTKAVRDGLQYDLEDKQGSSEGDKEGKVKGEGEKDDEDMGKRKSRMRDATSLTTEAELKAKQQENFERLQRELERRAEMGTSAAGGGNEGMVKDWLQLNAYPKGANTFPADAAPHRLVVDQENETILFPIHGYVVPVHISLIKTVTKLDETIRFQFHVPGKGKMSVSANSIAEENPNAVWLKELVYHLQSATLLASIDRSIKEMRKRVAASEKRKADLAGITEQDQLILSRERAPQLVNLYARPSLAGKRVMGTLEAHKNGFRYTTVKGQKLDVLYNNIANAFFQPAEQEALVILHFNLINPIVIGKRKTTDVQFVQETMEASSRLDSRRRNYGDADEIEEEQREKIARKKINRTFFKFCKDVEEFAKKNDAEGEDVIKFDFPSRELGFYGVPFKSNVLLQPTAQDCLVHLVEGPPFFVLSLDDVEVASFERVMFGLRQFDLVFVLKDYSKNPITVNSIPVEALEMLQEWLTKSNVLFYLNPQPYNWQMIMNEVRSKTLKQFLSEGGWSFLGKAPAEEEEEAEPSSEENEEDFRPEESESESSFGDEDDEDEDDEDDEEGSEPESGSEEEEGEDWDELDRKAEASDKKKWGGEKSAAGAAPDAKKRKPNPGK